MPIQASKKSTVYKPKENKWIKAMDLLKQSHLVGAKPETNKQREMREIIEVLNTTTYRTKYKTQKLRANSHLRAGGLMDKSEYFLLKSDAKNAFDKIKVISDPSKSASDSVVIILVKGKQQFIMKITFVNKKEALEYNAPDTEARFYSIMETLVKKKITPHVFMLTDCLWENIPRSDLESNFNKFLKKYNINKTHIYPILTETGNKDSALITFNDLMYDMGTKSSELVSRILLNVLFQIVYTIYCFIKIDFKHNDLHTGNIFILKRPENIIKNPKLPEQFKRRYTFDLADGTKRDVLLENLGLDVRIFDFDRSVKQKNNFKYHPEGLKSRFLRKYHTLGTNSINNPHVDLFKILKHIRVNVNTPRKVKNILDLFFIQRSLLMNSEFINSQGKKVSACTPYGKSYHLLSKKLPPGVLMDCDQVLNILATNVDSTTIMKNKSVLESFSTYNIKESEKERIMKTLKTRAAAKTKVASPKKVAKVASPKKVAKVASTKKANNSSLSCDDKKTKRSTQKTSTKGKNGKERRGKLIDKEAKNCMFPFKNMISQGRGKPKLSKMESGCIPDNFGSWCATERNTDCTPKKVAYCQ